MPRIAAALGLALLLTACKKPPPPVTSLERDDSDRVLASHAPTAAHDLAAPRRHS